MTGPWIHLRFYPLRSVESNKHTYILLYVNGIIQLVSLLVIALTSLSHSRAMLRLQSCDWSNATFEHFFYYTPITTDHVSNCEKYVAPLDFFDKIIMWEGSDQLVFFLNSLFQVLWNPFDDIVPRALSKPLVESTADSDKKDTTKKKAVK